MFDKIFFVLCFIWLLIMLSCTSTSTNAGVGQSVFDSAKQIGELSEQNRQLTERIEREQELYQQFRDSIQRAEADAVTAAGDIRAAIELLRVYKQGADRYFQAVDSLSGEVKSGD